MDDEAMSTKEKDSKDPASPESYLIAMLYDLGFRTSNKLENGIASLTEVSFPYPSTEGAKHPFSNKKRLELEWQGCSELNKEHGLFLCSLLLDMERRGSIGPTPIEKLKRDIARLVGNEGFVFVEAAVERSEGTAGKPHLQEITYRALWAQLFSERLSVDWLAAMAMHAHFVEKNDFAAGYLTALIDQKRGNEKPFLSGVNLNAGSSKGGWTRSEAYRQRREQVIRAMKPLVQKHRNVSLAADIAFRRGLGTSKQANRQIWQRYKPE